MPKQSDTQILLMLLKKVPNAKTVERLLKPENLLVLLPLYGHSQEEAQQRLDSDTLPGELLLELLAQEPDADRLLAQLPDQSEDLETAVPPPLLPLPQSGNPVLGDVIPTWRMPSRYSPKIAYQDLSIFAQVCMGLAIITVVLTGIFPAIAASRFYENYLEIAFLPPQILTFIAVVGGILAGILAYPISRSYLKGILITVAFNVGGIWSMLYYVQDREWLVSGEAQFFYMVGILPVCLLYLIFFRRAVVRSLTRR